jgi:hypothetical protein
MAGPRGQNLTFRAGSDRLESSLAHDGAGRRRPSISFGKLQKTSEKFRQAFIIVHNPSENFQFPSENFAAKPRFFKGLRSKFAGLPAERLNAP